MRAVTAASEIQAELQEADWLPEIAELYEARQGRHAEEKELAVNGLRVRIGLHVALPNSDIKCRLDEVTTGYDYYGTPVNVAARVEAKAFGGEVLLSDDLVQFLGLETLEKHFYVENQGPVQLKGITGGQVAWRMLPQALAERQLPVRRPDDPESPIKPRRSTEHWSRAGFAVGLHIGQGLGTNPPAPGVQVDPQPHCMALSHCGKGIWQQHCAQSRRLRAPAWEGAEAAPVGRGTTVPLSTAKRYASPSFVDAQCGQIPGKPKRCVHPRVPSTDYQQPAHLLSLYVPPATCPRLFSSCQQKTNGTTPGNPVHHRWVTHHRWVALGDPEPPGPCVTFRTSFLMRHPPNFTFMGMTECEAWPAPAWEGPQGAAAALVSRGTTVPLSSPIENTFPRWLGAGDVNSSFQTTQTSGYIPKYQLAHLLRLDDNPPLLPLLSSRMNA